MSLDQWPAVNSSHRLRIASISSLFDSRRCSTAQSKLAARHLFSALFYLEQLGVLGAMSGGGVPGQLDDEIVHREVFRELAEATGGLVAPSREISRILAFVHTLRGPIATVLLNLIGEVWLTSLFASLASSGLCPKVLAEIEADEARHATAEIPFDQVDREEIEPLLRKFEEYVVRMSSEPSWAAPVAHFLGHDEAARVGLRTIEIHAAACKKLGVPPADGLASIEAGCRATLYAGPAPGPVPLSVKELNRNAIFKQVAPIYDSTWVSVPTSDPSEIEALTVRAVGQVLAERPSLKLTRRTERNYRPREVIVGVRRMYDRMTRTIVTVFVREPQLRPTSAIRREIARRLQRLREHDLEPIPEIGDLASLLPAPRVSVLVSNAGVHGARKPYAPMVELEGAAANLAIGRYEKGRVHFGVTADHRLWDGAELGWFTSDLERAMRDEGA